jgi:dUTP pyrophosphatase
MKVKFKKLHKNAVIPQYAHPGEDAGLDLTCTEMYESRDFISYKTGIAIEVPVGFVGYLFPRSSNCKKDLLLTNSVGVIDSGYRGEIEFRYKRISNDIDTIPCSFYTYGDKVGQLIIMPYPFIESVEAEELSESNRGEKGYGSSGN